MAAIKAQAQVALLAGSAAPRDHALAQVVAAADRAGRLVEQLLRLSRVESGAPPAFSDCALRPLAREVLAELAPRAIAGSVALELDDGPGIPPAERDRVQQRFHRLPGAGDDGRGLRVTVELPARPG